MMKDVPERKADTQFTVLFFVRKGASYEDGSCFEAETKRQVLPGRVTVGHAGLPHNMHAGAHPVCPPSSDETAHPTVCACVCVCDGIC